MTLLTAVNRAQRRLSLTVTSGVVADGQETQNLLWELANVVAEDLLAKDWPQLRRTQSFTASTASLQADGKASNFFRAINDTMWNATRDRKIFGPVTEQEWAALNGEPITTGITQYAMFRYDGLHLYPVPTVADTITYDYIINTPVQATGAGAYKTGFTADNDVFLLDERLLVRGIRWRYLADKGRDYAEALKDYEYEVEAQLNATRSARVLKLAPADVDPLFPINVPDTGFGQ